MDLLGKIHQRCALSAPVKTPIGNRHPVRLRMESSKEIKVRNTLGYAKIQIGAKDSATEF